MVLSTIRHFIQEFRQLLTFQKTYSLILCIGESRHGSSQKRIDIKKRNILCQCIHHCVSFYECGYISEIYMQLCYTYVVVCSLIIKTDGCWSVKENNKKAKDILAELFDLLVTYELSKQILFLSFVL